MVPNAVPRPYARPVRMLSHIPAEDLRELYFNFPVATCLVGRDGRYIAANRAYAELIHAPLATMMGKHIAELCGDIVHAHVVRDFATFDAGESVPNHELAFFGRFYVVAVRPMRDKGSPRVEALCIALTDITEQKALESRLELANRQLSEANRQLTEAARTDALSGLWNRHALEEMLAREIGRCRRERAALSVLMIDIDHFKKYNDGYGHPAGDGALRAVSHAMAGVLKRPGDIVARYGGEEFLVVLPTTDASGALRVAGDVRDAIAALAIAHEASTSGRLTVSIGVASLSAPARTATIADIRATLIDGADQALYAVKVDGGDGIRLHAPDQSVLDRRDGAAAPA